VNRIYLLYSTTQLKTANKGRLYLAYLLLRGSFKRQAGGFSLANACKSLRLKERACGNMLKKLEAEGMIRKEANNHFRIVGHRHLFPGYNRNLCHCISDAKLRRFSLRYISKFRAFLSELEAERYKRHKAKADNGYTITDKRDNSRSRIKNQHPRQYDLLMSLECMSKLTGISKTTASSYRKKQNVVKYKWEMQVLSHGTSRKHIDGKWRLEHCEKGKAFILGDKILYSPISTRTIKQKKFILSMKA
jgi:hypothetical protein